MKNSKLKKYRKTLNKYKAGSNFSYQTTGHYLYTAGEQNVAHVNGRLEFYKDSLTRKTGTCIGDAGKIVKPAFVDQKNLVDEKIEKEKLKIDKWYSLHAYISPRKEITDIRLGKKDFVYVSFGTNKEDIRCYNRKGLAKELRKHPNGETWVKEYAKKVAEQNQKKNKHGKASSSTSKNSKKRPYKFLSNIKD